MRSDELQAIHARMERLEGKLDDLLAAVSAQVASCEPCRQRLDTTFQAIYGNGRDGLVTRVDRLEMVRRLSIQLAAGVLGAISGVLLTLLAWFLENWR